MNLTGLSKAGSWASIACAVHCMALPLLVTLLPAIGLGFALSRWFDRALLYSAVALSTAGMCWGYRSHRQKHKAAMLLALIAAGFLYIYIAHQVQQHMAFWLLMGGICFVWANLWNMALCRSCHHCGHEHPAP